MPRRQRHAPPPRSRRWDRRDRCPPRPREYRPGHAQRSSARQAVAAPSGPRVDQPVPGGLRRRTPREYRGARGGCHRGRVRRHRDFAAVRDEGVPGRRRAGARRRHGPGHRVAGVLGADPRGDGQVPHVHHARRQPRRGRGAGAARAAARRPAPWGQREGDCPGRADPGRRRPALRRRGADPGDLGAQRRRGHRGAQPEPGAPGRAGDVRDPADAVPGAVAGHPDAGPRFRPGDDRVVRPDRRPRPRRGRQGPLRGARPLAELRAGHAHRQRGARVPAAGLDHPGGDRRRRRSTPTWATSGHGPSGWRGCAW